MVGLGNSIVSLPEFKYSASFDGVDDFIDTGQTFQSTFRDSFTISFWAKPDDGRPSDFQHFWGQSSDNDNKIRAQLRTDGDFRFIFSCDTETINCQTLIPVFSDGAQSNFKHILISITKPSSGNITVNIYVNGKLNPLDNSLTTTFDESFMGDYTPNGNFAIGIRENDLNKAYRYSGKIHELGIFSRAVTQAIVDEIYNNGSAKNLNNIETDNASNNLVAYYKMGDGFFDDKSGGVVYNQVNPGLGSDLVVNGDFSISNTYNTTGSPWVRTPSSGTTTVIDNGVATFTNVGSTYAKLTQPVTYTSGSAYKLTATVNGTSGKVMRFRDDTSPNQIFLGSSSLASATTANYNNFTLVNDRRVTMTGSRQFVVKYFVAANNSDELAIERETSSGSYTFTVDNVKLQKLNMIPGFVSSASIFSLDSFSDIPMAGVSPSKFSANFDGASDFIVLGKSSEIIPTNTSGGNVTLMFWVKMNSLVDGSYIFANKRLSDTSGGSSNLSLQLFNDSGNFKFRARVLKNTLAEINAGASNFFNVLTSTTTILNDRWYHVTLTTKNGEQKLYIKGGHQQDVNEVVQTNGNSVMQPSNSSDSQHLTYIGKFNDSIAEFDGLVSELAIFNTVLTSDAISSLCNSPFDFYTHIGSYNNSANLTHHYKMGGGTLDDRTRGVIHNQVNFEDIQNNLISNGDFSNGGSARATGTNTRISTIPNWTISNSDSSSHESVKLEVNNSGQLVISADNIGDGVYTDYGIAVQQLSAPLIKNKVYKFEFDLISASPTNINLETPGRIRIGTFANTTSASAGSGKTGISNEMAFAIGKHTIYFTPTGHDNYIAIGGRDDVTELIVDNISLKETSGNPGLTSTGTNADVTFSSDTPPL